MNLDFMRALKAPFASDNWIKKILIGGILMLIPIVNFIVLGYLVKALKNFINKQDTLPEYSDFQNLFNTGAKLFLGSILFAIPFGIIIGILILLLSIMTKAAAIYMILITLIEIIAILISLIMIAGFSMDEKILSMVNFKRMMNFLKDNDGLLSLIVGMIGLYVVYTVVSFASYLTVIGIILLPFLSFAMAISSYNIIGQFAANAPLIEEIKAEAAKN